MYTNYAYGVENGLAGQSGSNYNFLVTGTSDYTGSTGLMLKNNTTLGTTGNMGTRISQDNSDNAYLDFRTNAADGTKSMSFRMQDDTNTASVNNMLVLNKDTGNFTLVYGATIGGRMKASQYFVNKADTRTPVAAGIYLGHDNATTGYFKINMGTGTGGFNFLTLDQNGLNSITNLSLKPSGVAQIPYYSQTTNVQDTETTAVAMWDMQGNVVRGYNANQRVRAVESAVSSIESSVVATVPIKVNEVIQRLNTLKIWNTKISDLTMSLPPPQFTPSPVAGGTQVQLGLSVPLALAQDPSWQSTYINALAAVLGISASRIVISSVSATAIILTAPNPMYHAIYTVGGSTNVYIIHSIAPPPTSSNEPSADFVANLLVQHAQNEQSQINIALRNLNNGSDIIDTSYVPSQNKTSVTATPAPTQALQTFTGDWIQFQMSTPVAASSYYVGMRTPNSGYAPRTMLDHVLLGSYNGTSWIILDYQTNLIYSYSTGFKTFSISNTTPYSYYRLIGLRFDASSPAPKGAWDISQFTITAGGTSYPPVMTSNTQTISGVTYTLSCSPSNTGSYVSAIPGNTSSQNDLTGFTQSQPGNFRGQYFLEYPHNFTGTNNAYAGSASTQARYITLPAAKPTSAPLSYPVTLSGEWVQFQSSTTITPTSYSLAARYNDSLVARMPFDFSLLGSVNGTGWVLLDQQVTQIFPLGKVNTYPLNTGGVAYNYFRLVDTKHNHWDIGYLNIGQFYVSDASNRYPPKMTANPQTISSVTYTISTSINVVVGSYYGFTDPVLANGGFIELPVTGLYGTYGNGGVYTGTTSTVGYQTLASAPTLPPAPTSSPTLPYIYANNQFALVGDDYGQPWWWGGSSHDGWATAQDCQTNAASYGAKVAVYSGPGGRCNWYNDPLNPGNKSGGWGPALTKKVLTNGQTAWQVIEISATLPISS